MTSAAESTYLYTETGEFDVYNDFMNYGEDFVGKFIDKRWIAMPTVVGRI